MLVAHVRQRERGAFVKSSTLDSIAASLRGSSRQVAQIVTAPLCVTGGVLLERHRVSWRRRAA